MLVYNDCVHPTSGQSCMCKLFSSAIQDLELIFLAELSPMQALRMCQTDRI